MVLPLTRSRVWKLHEQRNATHHCHLTLAATLAPFCGPSWVQTTLLLSTRRWGQLCATRRT